MLHFFKRQTCHTTSHTLSLILLKPKKKKISIYRQIKHLILYAKSFFWLLFLTKVMNISKV